MASDMEIDVTFNAGPYGGEVMAVVLAEVKSRGFELKTFEKNVAGNLISLVAQGERHKLQEFTVWIQAYASTIVQRIRLDREKYLAALPWWRRIFTAAYWNEGWYPALPVLAVDDGWRGG